jgi:hypothetical protein
MSDNTGEDKRPRSSSNDNGAGDFPSPKVARHDPPALVIPPNIPVLPAGVALTEGDMPAPTPAPTSGGGGSAPSSTAPAVSPCAFT